MSKFHGVKFRGSIKLEILNSTEIRRLYKIGLTRGKASSEQPTNKIFPKIHKFMHVSLMATAAHNLLIPSIYALAEVVANP